MSTKTFHTYFTTFHATYYNVLITIILQLEITKSQKQVYLSQRDALC